VSKIETIDQAHRRLMCKALNKYGSLEKAFPYLSPSGSPTIRGLYNLRIRFEIVRNTKGVFE